MASKVIEQHSDDTPNVEPEPAIATVAETQLRWVLNQVDAPIALFDSEHRLVLFNQPLAELWCISPTWLNGFPFWQQLLPVLAKQHIWASRNYLELQHLLDQNRATRLSLGIGKSVDSCLQLEITPTPEGGHLLLFRSESVEQGSPHCKQTEECLRRSEQLYRTLVEHFPDGAVFLFDCNLRFTLANGRGLKDVGLSYQIVEGKPLWEVVSPQLCRLTESPLRSALMGESTTFEASYGDHTFQMTTLPCKNNAGEIFAAMLVTQDITAHKQVEQFLRQKNEQLGSQVEEQMTELRGTIEQLHQEVHQRQLIQKQLQDALQRLNFHFENSPLAVIEWDTDFRIIRWSREAENLFGWRSEEVLGKSPYDYDDDNHDPWKFVHEEDWQIMHRAIAALFSGQQQRNSFYHRNYTASGAIVHCESYNSVLFDEVGNVVSILSLILNVTERKLAEEELERQSLRLRLLTDITLKIRQSLHLDQILQTTVTEVQELLLADRVLIYRLFPDHTGKVVTEAKIPGLPSILGHTFPSEVFPPDYHVLHRQGKIQNVEDIETVELPPCHQEFLRELGVKAKLVVSLVQGTELWGLMIVHQCSAPRQWIPFEVELLQQLADQVSIALAQAQLLERLRLLESVVVNANDSVVITEGSPLAPPGPRILYANAAFTRMTGYSLDDVFGKSPRILQGPNTDRQALVKLREALQQRQPGVVELLNYRKDGSEFWVEMSIMPVANETGMYTHWVAIQRDITHRKQLEAELLRTLEKEKELNELKSRFVSMTSHEFRTPLSTILSAAELLEYYGHGWTEEERLEPLHLIQQSVEHMTQLLEDILIIGQSEADCLDFQPTLVDVTCFCHDLIAQMRVSIGKKHVLDYTSHCPLLNAWLDEKLLRQILTNLLSNAIKYSPASSLIHIDLTCENAKVLLQVQDQGMGIPAEDLPRLFDSFHRAKNVGTIPGTGLGLAIVKHCVDVHGGEITVESHLGKGTTFQVALPLGTAS